MKKIRKYRFQIVIFLLTIVRSLLSLSTPFLMMIWSRQEVQLTYIHIMVIVIILSVTLVLGTIIIYIREHFAEEFNIANAKQYISKSFQLRYDSIEESGSKNLLERIIMAVNSMYIYYTSEVINLWSDVFIIISLLIMTIMQSYISFALLVIMIPVNYMGYRLLDKKLREKSKKMQEVTSAGWQETLSVVGQTDYIKQLDSYQKIIEIIERPLKRVYNSMANTNKLAQVSSNLIDAINNIIKIIVTVFIVYRFVNSESNYFSFLFFSTMLPIFFSTLTRITNTNLNKRDVIIAREFIKWMEDNSEEDGTEELHMIESIKFNIDKLHINATTIKRKFTGEVKQGDIVWVQGESGSGKSSFVKLLLKFREENNILINGIDIRKYKNSSIRKQITYISQNNCIIAGTLRDNLFFGNDYSKEKEEELLKDPLLKGILINKDMDTMIHVNGANLSGGEKQKIAVLRGLLDDSNVLILDEITSNIDEKSANVIYQRIIAEDKNKLIFVISHNVEQIGFANKIIKDEK
jgi:ABC-type bacteriocin/lantibiotic exporters, contain an N-terminal double-glycine peptidase domain